jgi:hypothetical protein
MITEVLGKNGLVALLAIYGWDGNSPRALA